MVFLALIRTALASELLISPKFGDMFSNDLRTGTLKAQWDTHKAAPQATWGPSVALITVLSIVKCHSCPFNKDLLFQQWRVLPKSNDWGMQVHNGLITSAQLGTTLKSYTSSHGPPEVYQGCHWVWFNFFLCLILLPSPPFHRCWLLNQHSVWKISSQSLLSRAPNLQQSHFSPSAAMTLPEAPRMTNVTATFSSGLGSLPLFSSPLGQGQGEEKTSKGAVRGCTMDSTTHFDG